ncbi:Probable cytochrome c biosynthesis protein, partial [Linum grandiflorum]
SCVGSRITRELFTLKFKHVSAKCYPALLLRSNRSPLMLLRRRFFAFSSLRTGALGDTGREQAKRVDQEPIRIWILTSWWFLTVGILPGSWWAHHELGWGGWWFREFVENASFMPRILAKACIHSVILPLLHSWTSFLIIVTLPCCVSGTFSIRSGLLVPFHSFAIDDTRGIFLWRFFLLMNDISMILFSQMKRQTSVRRTYKKRWLWREVLLCTYVTRLACNPATLCYGRIKLLAGLVISSQQSAAGFRPATRIRSLRESLWRG